MTKRLSKASSKRSASGSAISLAKAPAKAPATTSRATKRAKKRQLATPAERIRGGNPPTDKAVNKRVMKDALRSARNAAGLSQAEAARRIGVHSVTLHVWENHSRADIPREANLAVAARVYGTTPDMLRGLSTQNANVDQEVSGKKAAVSTQPLSGAIGASKHPHGRPRSHSTRDLTPQEAIPQQQSVTRVTANAATANAKSRPSTIRIGAIPRTVYGRVFRALAELADNSDLNIDGLATAQKALMNSSLLAAFSELNNGLLSEEDMFAAIDASASAIGTFVSQRLTGKV